MRSEEKKKERLTWSSKAHSGYGRMRKKSFHPFCPRLNREKDKIDFTDCDREMKDGSRQRNEIQLSQQLQNQNRHNLKLLCS